MFNIWQSHSCCPYGFFPTILLQQIGIEKHASKDDNPTQNVTQQVEIVCRKKINKGHDFVDIFLLVTILFPHNSNKN